MGWTALADGEYSGDLPLDAFATAMERTAAAYRDRFGRLPRLREVLHAFKTVVEAAPDDYLDDPDHVTGNWIPAVPPSGRPALVVDEFKATWTEEPQPDGTYFLQRRSGGADVVSCTLALSGRSLEVAYQIFDRALSDEDARTLIVHALLKNFADDHYLPLADQVAFRHGRDPSAPPFVVPYPR
jgi:hypothetical protein